MVRRPGGGWDRRTKILKIVHQKLIENESDSLVFRVQVWVSRRFSCYCYLVRGPKLYYQLMGLLKSFGVLTDEEKKILDDFKSKFEESRREALKMCSVDLILQHELATREFYEGMTDYIDDLFGDHISHQILGDVLKLLKNIPEQIDNIDNIYTQLRICLTSILPKIGKLRSKGFSVSCAILTVFLAVFLNRRQRCAILIHRHDLGILNNAEAEIAKLIASAHMERSKFGEVVSTEMKKKIALGAMDVVGINLRIATIILNSIDVNDGFLTCETELVSELINKLEKDHVSYQKVYEILKTSSKERLKMQDITNWTSVIIYHIPSGIGEFGIKIAMKRFLGDEVQNCIDLKRLSTNGNNWLVKIPTNHSSLLLKEKYIYIAKKKCLIMA
ncbi:uncharacterized protein LOC129956870 isoform X2 [Argiope bruennichi]|uniref:uncharacterized protein LOC129956870 isoform X2 n=1 Tax=Argiope bruennichi TaxID=94029 RepID=UPI002494D9B5|nr:uncharacterized protein LOC129956870 isoform X2 [Argiope bruennichi]